MIAKAAAATSSLDAPVIDDDPFGLLGRKTQIWRPTFRNSEPHSTNIP
jgi:hypothetical protein